MLAWRLKPLQWMSILALAALSGCAATESKLAVPYEITLETAEDVNPDSSGRASPIQITFYELKARGVFQSSDYFALQDDPRQALGADLLDMQRVTLRPGQVEVISRPGHVEATALGVVAAYRDLDASNWRLLLELPEGRSTNIYKFWQFSPSGAEMRLGVNASGMTTMSLDD